MVLSTEHGDGDGDGNKNNDVRLALSYRGDQEGIISMYHRRIIPCTLVATAAALLSPVAVGPTRAHADNGSGFVSTATKAVGPRLLNAIDLGALSATRRMTVEVGLTLRNRAALDQYVHDANTLGNARYGQFLTPAQFLTAYGPTSDQVNAVKSYLTANGLGNLQVTPNNMFVTAHGTAAQVEAAFNTQIHRFRLTLGGQARTVYANTTDAQVPTNLGGTVAAVLGLNNASRMSIPLHHKTAATMATIQRTIQRSGEVPAAGTPAPPTSANLNGFHPPEYAKIYDAAGVPTGSNTSTAVFAEGDLTQVMKDLRQEEAMDGLPQIPYSVVPVGFQSADVSGIGEWDLDTQSSSGIAGNVQHLYVYDVGSLSDADVGMEFNRFVTDDVAKTGNASFGECESFPAVDGFMLMGDQIAEQAATQGQTIFASSGDTGSACAVAPTNGVPGSGLPEPEYPASSQFITSVGGTTLLATNSTGSPPDTYIAEVAWTGGGCGVSDFETQPPWQSGNVDAPKGGAPPAAGFVMGGRVVPDISMEADPNTGALVVVSGTVMQICGTSLASPLSMGVWARLETAHNNSLGYAAPLLYALYKPIPQAYPGFHDITLGNTGACQAAPGYDIATGLGTFDIAQNNAAIAGGTGTGSGGGTPTATPEPGSGALYGTGLVAVLGAYSIWRRRRARRGARSSAL